MLTNLVNLSYVELDLQPFVLNIMKRYKNRHIKDIQYGRNRMVLIFDKYVVKIPISLDGIVDNDWEASISNTEETKDNGIDIQYPRTRLIYHEDIPIVFMQKVKDMSCRDPNYTNIDWIGSVDCAQVGYTRSGRLVAYDYGLT